MSPSAFRASSTPPELAAASLDLFTNPGCGYEYEVLSRPSHLTPLAFGAVAVMASCGDDAASLESRIFIEDEAPVPPGEGGGDGGTTEVRPSCPSQDYSTVPGDECDLLAQDCPPGQGCIEVPDGASFVAACRSTNGLKDERLPCEFSNECKPGLACVFGRCSPHCCPDNDEPCGGGDCNVVIEFGIFQSLFCSFTRQCQPFQPDACPEGEGCFINAEQNLSSCIPFSRMPPGGEGEPCSALNACDDQMSCTGVCRFNCIVGAAGLEPGEGGCPEGQGCLVQPGVDIYGVCAP